LQYFYTLILTLLIAGCNISNGVNVQKVTDLQKVSQDVHTYTKGLDAGYISTLQNYKYHYFKPWNIERIQAPLAEAMWAYNIFTPENSYGENLQKIDQSFFDAMLYNSNFSEYASLNKPALTLKHLNLRAFPTQRPLLRDPRLAGEGFPFDYLQNSTIAANKPILVSHYSKDRAWVFVESSFAHGWVSSNDIVYIPKIERDFWQEDAQVFFIKDNVALYDDTNNFLFRSHIGMMLPLLDANQTHTSVLSAAKDVDNNLYFHSSILSKGSTHEGILSFNAKNINNIIAELQKVNYGWGGMYGQRDCSSTIRDFFAPFGIWLPRNSYKQSMVGKVIAFDNMSDKEKIATIKKYGVAFRTLLYKRGHIVLYVGTFNDKVIVFQNLWGIKTLKYNKAGRFIIGRPIFSTLEVGKNLRYYDKSASLLSNLKSMNILTF